MITQIKTFNILGTEFDMDTLNDIANHGMSAGFNGFIYTSELIELFDKNEDEIFDVLDSTADELDLKSGMELIINSLTKNDDYYDMQDIKTKSVWMYVELKAVELLVSNGHKDWA